MKAYVLGISLLTALSLGSFSIPEPLEQPVAAQSGEEIQPSQQAFMEANLSHLHHVHPSDIRQVPAI